VNSGASQPEKIADKPRHRLTPTRLLLVFVGLCLLLWDIKAIHHALQPKYQGKTAQEWFEEAREIAQTEGREVIAREKHARQPAVVALKSLGATAVWYLWKEVNHKDSTLTVWGWELHDRITGKGRMSRGGERQSKAYDLLVLMENVPEAFIAELAEEARGTDTEKHARLSIC